VRGNTVQSIPPPDALSFFDVLVTDDECATGTCYHSYYNTQAVIWSDPTMGTIVLRGNMEAEYR
jgi:hypothetical protein